MWIIVAAAYIEIGGKCFRYFNCLMKAVFGLLRKSYLYFLLLIFYLLIISVLFFFLPPSAIWPFPPLPNLCTALFFSLDFSLS